MKERTDRMRRRWLAGAFLIVGVTTSGEVLAENDVADVVILATNSVKISKNAAVLSGDVVVNDSSDGPTLDPSAELSIDRAVTVAGNVKADSIVVDNQVTLSGTVECNDGTGVTCSGLFLPVFDELPPFQEGPLRPEPPLPHDPGLGEDVAVGIGGTKTLDAGDYGDIMIDKGGTVVFSGGIYNIGSIMPVTTTGGPCSFDPCRSLEFEAPTELRIVGMFDTGRNGFVGPSASSPVLPSSIILYVGGTNLVEGDPNSAPPAAKVGRESTVEANIYAANGTLQLKRDTNVTGAFLGRDVSVDSNAQVTLASFFNPPPTADPQDVFTGGTTPLDITLTGSDPDGETLDFSIVSGPTNGTLTSLVPNVPTATDLAPPVPEELFASVRTAEVTYTAPDSEGTASFDFQACGDLNSDGDTLDGGECDTATVTLTFGTFTPPVPPAAPTAEDLTVSTTVDTPVDIGLSDQAGDGSSEPGTGRSGATDDTLYMSGLAQPAQALPNLDVTFFSAPACALLGEVVGDLIQVTVTNTGPADIPAGTAAAIGFYVSTDSTITTSDTLLTGGRENLLSEAPDGLLVGESITDFLFTGASINSGSPTGNVFIGVLADEFNVLAEDDETDNTASQPIEVKSATEACLPDQPDLVVSSLAHDPVSPTTADQINFKAVVKNVGDAPAGPSDLCLDIGDETCGFDAPLYDIPSLDPTETFEVVRTQGLQVAGNFLNNAVADFNDDVAESDETNNTATDTFAVTQAVSGLSATIVSLPTSGTLFDSSGGQIAAAGTTLPDTNVTYVPPLGVSGTASFTYNTINNLTGVTSNTVTVIVDFFQALIDLCVLVGRDPGCAPN